MEFHKKSRKTKMVKNTCRFTPAKNKTILQLVRQPKKRGIKKFYEKRRKTKMVQNRLSGLKTSFLASEEAQAPDKEGKGSLTIKHELGAKSHLTGLETGSAEEKNRACTRSKW